MRILFYVDLGYACIDAVESGDTIMQTALRKGGRLWLILSMIWHDRKISRN